MQIILISKDPELVAEAKEGFHPADATFVYGDWREALEKCQGADLMFVDLLATLEEPGKIAGYETFAQAKMAHQVAVGIPLVLISPDADYELDFMAGWPDFVLGNIRRPVPAKMFRRASTWV
jgi:hypothetical protein